MTPEQLREEIIADFYKVFSEENVWQGEDEYTKNVPIGNLEEWLRTALTRYGEEARREEVHKYRLRLLETLKLYQITSSGGNTYIAWEDLLTHSQVPQDLSAKTDT